MRENRLHKTLEEVQTDTISVGSYSSFIVTDNLANPTYAHLVQYNFIRCPQYARLDEEEEVFLFECEGLKYAIQGKNIFQLVRMVNVRRLSEVAKNQTIRFNSTEILITNIIVKPIKLSDEPDG